MEVSVIIADSSQVGFPVRINILIMHTFVQFIFKHVNGIDDTANFSTVQQFYKKKYYLKS